MLCTLKVKVTAISFLFILLSLTGTSFAQQGQSGNDSTGLQYWVFGGPAITTLGPGTHAGLSFEYNKHVFSARTISTDLAYGSETWEVALLYGRSTNYRNFYLSGSVGASVIGGIGYTDLFGRGTESDLESSMGFPVEGRFSWQPIRFLSIGIYSFLNVNTEQPFGGMGVNLQVGKL